MRAYKGGNLFEATGGRFHSADLKADYEPTVFLRVSNVCPKTDHFFGELLYAGEHGITIHPISSHGGCIFIPWKNVEAMTYYPDEEGKAE